jgi:tRNA nucleotidyltransferase (CCA-adding enzyme)
MAKTISESFQQFASNLNISDRQESLVSSCRKNVVEKIANKLTLHSEQPSKLIGSYDRNTLIRYLIEADVDVMVVLHYGKNKDWDNDEGVSKVLSAFKTIIKESYPDTECQIDRNCVTMKLSEFRQDVVPAFRFKEGYYTIPDTYRGSWIQTDPAGFAEEITRNHSCPK